MTLEEDLYQRAHSKWKHLLGKQVDITVGRATYTDRELFFVGINQVGMPVISFHPERCLLHIKDWSKVKIEAL